jgi:hypothetical protein
LTTGRTDSDEEFLTTETVGPYLVDRGIFSPADELRIAELGGGVSNIVLRAESPSRAVVLKQALPRLRVADEWLANRERAINEAEALRLVGGITPDRVPVLVDLDRERCALVTSAAPWGRRAGRAGCWTAMWILDRPESRRDPRPLARDTLLDEQVAPSSRIRSCSTS